jgi:hypothetical protein
MDKQAMSFQEVEGEADYLLGDRYPVSYKHDIEKASQYFDNYHHMFSKDEKVEYAQNLAKKAQEMKEPVSDLVTKYACISYGDYCEDFEYKLGLRSSLVKDDFSNPSIYSDLAEKQASLDPEKMAQEIEQADKETGLWAY